MQNPCNNTDLPGPGDRLRTTMRKVLIADDDPHIREVVCFALGRAGFETVQAAHGTAALRAVSTEKPDLVVLDVLMPELDGVEVCRVIRQSSSVPILFLSSKDDEVDRVVGLEIGGDDYVTKPFSPRELVARVKALLRRNDLAFAHADEVLHAGPLTVDTGAVEASWGNQRLDLTHTEFLMLATLARNAGRALTRDALMQGAYDSHRIVSDRTIDSHIRRLRDKLKEVGGNPVQTVHGVGYRFSAD